VKEIGFAAHSTATVFSGARSIFQSAAKQSCCSLLALDFAFVASIGTASAATQAGHPAGTSNNLVSAFVVLREPPAADVWQNERKRSGLAAARDLTRRHLDEIDSAHAALRSALAALGARETGRLRKVANAIRIQVRSDRLQAVSLLPGVARVQEARLYTRATTTSVSHSGAPPVWMSRTAQADGAGVRVGIIDSGIDYTHADFGGPGVPAAFLTNDSTVIEPGTFPTAKVVGGYDFVGDDYDPNDPAHEIPQPDPDPLDANGHGTAVAGIAGGFGVLYDGNAYTGAYSNTLDLASFSIGPGMAPRSLLYALKVFGRAGNTWLAADALEWASDPNNDGDLSDRLDVVNLSIVSSFGLGTSEDVEVVAADSLARLGCVVVCSGGNSGNTFYIGGGPGSAPSAISTANLNDFAGAVQIISPPSVAGFYVAPPAVFGTQLSTSGPIVDSLVYAGPNDACDTLTNPTAVAGRIALIDRGTCLFVEKVQRAEQAGAIAVIVVNNVPGPPIEMGGTNELNIPSVMISQADGQLLKNALAGNAVTARLDASLVSSNDIRHDAVADSSSRGPLGPHHLLKPEISAPGNGVFTARVATGNQGERFSGTSSAAPHVAGAAALLKQLHPTWPTEDIKAALLNTAAAVQDTNGVTYPESRVGAGRLQVDRAAVIQVTAAADATDGRVALSFGALELIEPATVTGRIRLTNHGSAPVQFTIAVSNTVSESGVLVEPSSGTLNVPAFGSATVDVELSAIPSLFDRTFDPTTPVLLDNRARAGIYEVSGELWFNSSSNTIHLPYYAVVRAAAQQKAAGNLLWPDDADPLVVIPIGGRSAHPQPLVSAFQLGYFTNSLQLDSPGDSPADLLAVGAACDAASVGGFTNSVLFFGLVTASPWTTPQSANVGLLVELDSDFNGLPNAIIFNTSLGNIIASNLTTGTDANDVLMTAVKLSTVTNAGTHLNYFPPDVRDTVLFNTRVLVEPVPVASLGLTSSQSRFAYRVRTFGIGNQNRSSRLVKETPWIVFDAANPGLDSARGLDGTPFFLDGGAVTAVVHRAAFDAYPQHAAVLLLHHMNTVSNQMEIIRFVPRLTIAPSGNELVLKWPDPGPFMVQMATNLAPSILWNDLATATNQYRIPSLPLGPQFFRLLAF
jgi:subtilisin family serine protease